MYSVIKNFKGGLSTSGLPLNREPGTLSTLLDAVVNRSGEIEKANDLELIQKFLGSPGVNGLVATSDKIYTFGSAAQGTFSSSYLTYQQLQHPAVLEGVSYDVNKHLMVQVMVALNFANKPFVAVKFSDEQIFCYYDGSLVRDFRDGLVLYGLNANDKVAAHLKTVLEKVPSLHVGSVVAGLGGAYFVEVYSNPGVTFKADAAVTSTLGTIAINHVTEDTVGTVSEGATATFGILAGDVGGKVTNLTVVDNVTAAETELINSAMGVAWAGTRSSTAAALVTNINSFQPSGSTIAYEAKQGEDTVYIVAKPTAGLSANGFYLRATTSGPFVAGKCRMLLAGGPGSTCTSVKIGATECLKDGTAVAWAVSTSNWASLIATSINEATGAYGFGSAVASGNYVYLSRRVTRSDDGTDTITFTVSGAGASATQSDPADIPSGTNPLGVILEPTKLRFIFKVATSTAEGSIIGGKWVYTITYRIRLQSYEDLTKVVYVTAYNGTGTYSGEWRTVKQGHFSMKGGPWHAMSFGPNLDTHGSIIPMPTSRSVESSEFVLDVRDSNTNPPGRGSSMKLIVSGVIVN